MTKKNKSNYDGPAWSPGVYQSYALPLIRRRTPALFAEQLVSVTPSFDSSSADRVIREARTPNYLDWGHMFGRGYYVVDENLEQVFDTRDNHAKFAELWTLAQERHRANRTRSIINHEGRNDRS